MPIRSTLLLLGALVAAPALAGEKVSLDTGPGDHWSKGAHATFLRYSRDLKFPNFPSREGFYEFSAGAWDGKHPNKAAGLAIGARERWGDLYLEGSAGLAYAVYKTHLSATHQQFILRVGVGYQIERFDVGAFVVHYSNAKKVFDWDGKNVGYDFLTIQARYSLK